MEIPDVIAVNKSDHPAAKTMVNEVRSILALDTDRDWQPPIVLTEAVRGEGIEELWGEISRHIAPPGERRSPRRAPCPEPRRRGLRGCERAGEAHLEDAVRDDPELQRLLEAVQRRELDPLTAVREIMEKVFKVHEGGDRPDTR